MRERYRKFPKGLKNMKVRWYTLALLAFLIVVSIAYYSYWFVNNRFTLNIMNENLMVENIKFGLSESEVIRRWGPGKHIGGFGGHGRKYNHKGITISFPDDRDNDLYGKVGSLYFTNTEFSVFGIKVGDNKAEGISILISNRFKPVNYSDDIFISGEFAIVLKGKDEIEYIQIYFNDKDLKDRSY